MSTTMQSGTSTVAKAAKQSATTTTITTKDNGTSIILSNDIDDFVTPSMACINPIFSSSVSSVSSVVSAVNTTNNNNNNDTSITTTNKVIPRKRRVVINSNTNRQRVASQPIRVLPVPVVTNDTTGTDTTATGSNKTDTNNVENASLAVKNKDVNIPSVDTNTTGSKNVNHTNTNSNTTKLSDVVKASLADCLACSGCITTAETVLLEEQHSLDVLRLRYKDNDNKNKNKKINNKSDIGIVTISPASYADICRHLSLGQLQQLQQSVNNTSTTKTAVQCKVTTLLYEMWNIILVIDGNVPLLCSLHESAIDFCATYNNKQHRQQQQQEQCNNNNNNNNNTNNYNTNTYPSVALSSTRVNVLLLDGTIETIDDNNKKSNENNYIKNNIDTKLPIISSSCPATVCLIEKSIPTAVSHIHTIRSPMSIAGSVVMHMQHQHQEQQQFFLNKDLTTTVSSTITSSFKKQSIFHIAIMPCHDKKLEASRKDFYNDTTKQNDISIVITTAEFLLLMEEYIVSVQSQQEQQEHHAYPSGNAEVVRDYIDSRQESKCITLSSTDEFISSTSIVWNTILNAQETTIVPTFITIPTLQQQQQTQQDERTNTINNTNTSTNEKVEQEQDYNNVTTTNSIVSSFFPYGSGGYADYIFRHAAYNLFGYTISSNTTVWTTTTSIATYLATNNSINSTNNSTNNKSTITKRVSVRVARQRQKDFYTATLYKITNNESSSVSYSTTKSIDNSNSNSNSNTTIEPVLRFAIAYGMPTLQQVLNPFHQQQTTTTTNNCNNNDDIYKNIPNLYHYVEAMACPSGCINGGGQIRSTTTSTTSSNSNAEKNTNTDTVQQSIQQQQQQQRETPTQTRERIERTEQCFQYPSTSTTTILKEELIQLTSKIEFSKDKEEEKEDDPNLVLLRTRFHIVPKMQYNTGAVAGVSVSDTQW